MKVHLCYYRDAYILISGTTIVAASAAGRGNNNIQLAFKNCAPFTNCINEINNIQIDNAKDIDVVIPIYNLKNIARIIQNIRRFIVILWR